MKPSKPILAVGSIALDSLETVNGNETDILGGSLTYFALSASLFCKPSVLGVVGKDFPLAGWKLLKDKNIDINNIEVKPGKTFRWGGRYNKDYSARETLFTDLGVFGDFSPIIKNNYKNADFLFLGNIQPDLQLSVAEQMSSAKTVVCDTMNLWIDLSLERLYDVLSLVDIFLLNDEEALQITSRHNLSHAADALHDRGPSVVIIKQGAKGSLLSWENKKLQLPVFPIKTLIDPTGAGDSFAGGLIGHLAVNGKNSLIEAVAAGSAIASFTVSQFGVRGLLNIKPAEIEARKQFILKSINQ